MKSKEWRFGSILLVVFILAGAMSGIAFADTNTDKPDMPDMTAMYQDFVSKFADNLGVSEDEVTAALEETQIQMIDEAVEEGTLTQEQADQMTEKIESGEVCGLFGLGGGPGPGGNGGPGGPGGNSGDTATE